MARADYRLCDVCDSKVFYDANLNYDEAREKNDPESFRMAGAVEPWGARLDYLGDWAVICSHCAKTHKTIVVPIEQERSEQAKDARRYRWIAGHCRSTSEHWGGRWSIVVEGPCPTAHDTEDAFDAAIDAAMRLTRPAEER